jgi:hypothetical protein
MTQEKIRKYYKEIISQEEIRKYFKETMTQEEIRKYYKEIENRLNQSNRDWNLTSTSDDGRKNSQDSEPYITEQINEEFEPEKRKTSNREDYDIYLLMGEDLKIVEPENFTNTISFVKLSKMLNLKGKTNKKINKSYIKQKLSGQLKLIHDYYIIFLNKKTKKFKICLLTELPISCITVNPSNGIQTKIPDSIVIRTEEEKFNLVHNLFIEYINKRILTPAKEWESIING